MQTLKLNKSDIEFPKEIKKLNNEAKELFLNTCVAVINQFHDKKIIVKTDEK